MITIQRLIEELEHERRMRRMERSNYEYLMDFSRRMHDTAKKTVTYWKTRAIAAEDARLRALYKVK